MDLHYQLVRSRKRRRTLSLQVKDDGKIFLHVPFRTPKGEIERFIKERRSWICRKLSEKTRQLKETGKKFVPGEKFLFLGEWYPLTLGEDDQGSPLKLWSGSFCLMARHIGEARDFLIHWYRKEAKERITERAVFHGNRLSLHPKGIRITDARHRWGSCSRSDRLCFSWRVVMAPLPIIDYVLIHELVHIREKNHSRRFWGSLESILPDYRKRRRWLADNGHLLQI